jgi:outer membrane protein assembly factor BamB
MKNFGKTIKSANKLNKNTAFSVALILILTISTTLTMMPTGKAAVPNTWSGTPTKGSNGNWNIPSFAGITCAPNPVGVGQPIQVIMVIEQLPPSQGFEFYTGTTGGWPGLMLTITDPNGTKTTMGPYLTDTSGTYQIVYTPTTTGNYSFQFSWPGETVDNTQNQGTSSFVQYWGNFLGATSNTETVTVTNTPTPGFTEAPLPRPNDYWKIQVNDQNRYWSTICGPWLQSNYNATGAFNPYSYAPQSPHILWTTNNYVISSGDLAGGQYGSLGFGGMNTSPTGMSLVCVMDGYAYYNGPTKNNVTVVGGLNANQPVSYFYCMNIQTGEIMWSVPGSITCGQMLCQRGQQTKNVSPTLWSIASGSYKQYSATTGALLAEWHNLPAGATVYTTTGSAILGTSGNPSTTTTPTAVTVTAGTVVEEPPHPTIVGQNVGFAEGGGALLVYIYGRNPNAATGWLACWNSSLAIVSLVNNPTSLNSFPSITAQETTTPLNWNWGIMWNVTVPLVTTDTGTGATTNATWNLVGCDGQYAILQTSKNGGTNHTGVTFRTLAAIRVDNLPMTTTYIMDMGGNTQHPTTGTFAWCENYSLPPYDQTYTGNAVLESGGNIIVNDNALLCIWDFDTATGALKWTSTPYNNQFALQSSNAGVYANGMVYVPGYDGYMHAINATTGVQMWDSPSAAGGQEMPQPNYPMSGCVIAGTNPSNTMVFTSTRKSYEAQPVYRGHCLYAFNGQTGAQMWNISGEFSIYCIANGILIGANNYDNTVYAFGAGRSATTVTAPMTSVTAGSNIIIQGTVTDQTDGILKGTPAISDPYMGSWMAYMFMDQAMPTSATGVPVSIDAIDPNGNFVHIGDAVSDNMGAYSYVWAPPSIAGSYHIIATFGGSNSYASSSGETAMTVEYSPVATTVPLAAQPADNSYVVIGTGIAVIIAIAIVGLLILRKRP